MIGLGPFRVFHYCALKSLYGGVRGWLVCELVLWLNVSSTNSKITGITDWIDTDGSLTHHNNSVVLWDVSNEIVGVFDGEDVGKRVGV